MASSSGISNNLKLSAICVALMMGSAASAQEATGTAAPQAGAGDQLQDIVVTAQRREQRLQDVPVAVSVISGDALERQSIRSLEDVTARMANVKITSGTAVDQVYIRGVGSGQDPGFEQTVGTFADGVYRSRSRSTRAALFDIERVEVLKGPQATFFGANASAGAINITTRKPGDELSYNASALWGPALENVGYGEYDVEGGVSVPLSQTLSMRVAARLDGTQGWLKDDYLGWHGTGPDARNEQGRVSFRWKPTDNFRTDFRIDAYQSRADNAVAVQLTRCPPPAPYVVTASTVCGRFLAFAQSPDGAYLGGKIDDKLDDHTDVPPSWVHFTYYESALTNTLDLDVGTITSLTGFYYHDYLERGHNAQEPLAGTPHGYDPFPVILGERYHQISQELRFTSPSGHFLEYMFGGYFAADDLNAPIYTGRYLTNYVASAPASLGLAPDTPLTQRLGMEQKSDTASGFGTATLHLTEQLRFNAGIRYSREHKTAHHRVDYGSAINDYPSTYQMFPDPAAQTFFSNFLGVYLNDYPHPSRTDSKWLPSAGFQYDFNRDLMAYATYTTGFKAGGYGDIASKIPNEFGPESVYAFEVGVKSQLFDRRLTLNADVYYSKYKNLQESSFYYTNLGQVVSVIANVASSKSQGLELGATFRPTSWFSVSTDAAYLDAKYISFPNGPCSSILTFEAHGASCTQDMSGKQRPYAPKWSGNIAPSFAIMVGGKESKELRFDPLFYFTSAFYENASADAIVAQPGFVKIDARVSYGPQSRLWELALVTKNLTDKTTSGFRQPTVSALGSVTALVDPPRSVALQFLVRN